MNIRQAADPLLFAECKKQPIAPFTSSAESISVDDAYAIQLLQITGDVHPRRGSGKAHASKRKSAPIHYASV